MDFLQPRSLREALELKAARPEALPVAGGTDVMVELNFDRSRPAAILDLGRVPELEGFQREDGRLRLGARMTYTQAVEGLGRLLPGLAIAARTVGSPQIRNRGTIGGNLGSASPAGDALPPLLAAGAEVEVASARGTRRLAMTRFLTGPKRSDLAPDELILAVRVPAATGPQQFAKVGPRNAMVIAVCSFALCLDPERRRVGTGIGSAGPTPLAATEAERFLESELGGEGLWESPVPLGEATLVRFGELAAAAARPIDDVRGTAAYRVRALAVLARRTLAWAWDDYTDHRE
ncbi:MAG TPA: FAD binding domain-containing protein [Actinomycetes bacterium]|jgi:CO/xanthine dehydrogenase FAD-binding subunit|nr:FAD binding domain-containing protein [Actinomycetes bacterium]